jgi:hypothetical protein
MPNLTPCFSYKNPGGIDKVGIRDLDKFNLNESLILVKHFFQYCSK